MVRVAAVLAVLGGAVFGGAGGAQAHPHVFIDAGIEVIFDAAGRAEALRITWTYDDLISLTIIGDRGLDRDWDGALTPDETAALAGFDMAWDADFPGDTYAILGAVDLALRRPEGWTATYAGQKITSTHLRRFADPVAVGGVPLIVQVYDPGFYTAYRIATDPVLTGRAGCEATAFAPDLSQTDAQMKQALLEYSGSQDVEADFPAIGKVYAEEVRVTCSAG